MALLQMINFQHHGEPHLSRRGMRRRAVVRETGFIVALKARNPPGDRRAGDVQKLTDAALTPALRIQGDDLAAGLEALGMTLVGKGGRGGGAVGGRRSHRRRAVWPVRRYMVV